jgi:hypothetical protein
MTVRRGAALGLACVVLVAGVAWRVTYRQAPGTVGIVVADSLPRHVRVEVMNSAAPLGAAGRATTLLRHGGLDVVLRTNAPAALRGRRENEVLVRRGDTTGVGRIIDVLGPAVVSDAPDSTRLVELTVLLGSAFAPPPEHLTIAH